MAFSGDKRAAGAVGGRTARPCDGCGCRRARWYCAADDAFLCQACDSSVHSANPLAGRHQRVRLKMASTGVVSQTDGDSLPSWFCRKARSPRTPKKPIKLPGSELAPAAATADAVMVPDVAGDENSGEEVDELLCRVPVFDRMDFLGYDDQGSSEAVGPAGGGDEAASADCDDLPAFLSSDVNIADLDELLGGGDRLYDDNLGVEVARVKLELDEELGDQELTDCTLDGEFDFSAHMFDDIDFDPCEFGMGGEADMKMHELGHGAGLWTKTATAEKRKLMLALRLDYKAVIAAWDSHGSPWTTGDRPKINFDDPLPADCMVKSCGWEEAQGRHGGSLASRSMAATMGVEDGGREARVSRYREKRRTRLFSKKIRYEVRKLNAEKRPRMKGRFVKRTPTFAMAHASPF